MTTLLQTAVLAICALSPAIQDPTTEQIEASVEELRVALSKGDAAARITALAKASSVPDSEVCKWVAKGLSDKDETVQAAAIESLRFMDHPAALDALQSGYKRKKALRDHDQLSGAVLRAIGQHANTKSISFLAEDPFSSRHHSAIRARILGLGNIRDKRSVEELVALMKKASRRKTQPFMDDFRLALMRLTGVDEGKSIDLWIKWWNNNKRTFEVPAVAPKLPKMEQWTWDYYWGNEITRERTKKRGDRGDD